jgi:putative SOS response-associated peptidase YedK
MCGRVRLTTDYSEIKIALQFDLDAPAPNYAPDWNKPPTELMLVAIRSEGAEDDALGFAASLGERREAFLLDV